MLRAGLPIAAIPYSHVKTALSDSHAGGYPVAALPASSFAGALSMPALRTASPCIRATIERLRDLLARNGVLICANLGLASAEVANRLHRDF